MRSLGQDFVAPDILRIEVRNALLKAERRGLLLPHEADEALADLDSAIDVVRPQSALDDIYRLGRAEALSFFDACYLDCAIGLGVALASRDGALLAAAQRRGLLVSDLR